MVVVVTVTIAAISLLVVYLSFSFLSISTSLSLFLSDCDSQLTTSIALFVAQLAARLAWLTKKWLVVSLSQYSTNKQLVPRWTTDYAAFLTCCQLQEPILFTCSTNNYHYFYKDACFSSSTKLISGLILIPILSLSLSLSHPTTHSFIEKRDSIF